MSVSTVKEEAAEPDQFNAKRAALKKALLYMERVIRQAQFEGATTEAIDEYLTKAEMQDPVAVRMTAESRSYHPRMHFHEIEEHGGRNAVRSWFGLPPLSTEQLEQDRLGVKLQDARDQRLIKRLLDAEELPPREIPAITTLADRLLQPRVERLWRVSALQQARHRALLAAPAKAGKTLTTVNLVKPLVDGGKFLGNFRVEPVEQVSILDFEMAEQERGQLDDWYARQHIQHPEKIRIVPMRGRASAFNIMDPKIRRAWADRLRGTSYLVWDCLSTVIMALGLDENLEAQKLLVAFDELIQEAGIPECLVIQHMGHGSDRARGHSGILAWPDVLWSVTLDPAGDRYFEAFGREVNQPQCRLTFDPDSQGLGLDGQKINKRDAEKHRNVRRVVSLIQQHGPLNKTEVEDRAEGLGRNKARNALASAVESGLLTEDAGPKNSKIYLVRTPEPTNPRAPEEAQHDIPF